MGLLLLKNKDRLNAQYDSFVKKHGYINDSSNAQVFSRDDDYNSLCALEVIDEESKTIEKSDFFTKRTVKYTAEITRVDTPQEAMQVSIDTKGTRGTGENKPSNRRGVGI